MTARTEADLQAPLSSSFAFTLPDLLRALSRYRVRAFLVFASAIVVGLTLIVVTTPVYESHAVILIKFGREQVYRPELGADNAPIVPSLSEHDGMVDNQVEMFKSRDVVIPVIRAIGLARLYPDLVAPPRESEVGRRFRLYFSKLKGWISPLIERLGLTSSSSGYVTAGSQSAMEKAVIRFGRALSVSRERASDLVQVAFQHPDPKLAQATLHVVLVQQRWLSIAVHGGAEPGFYEAAISQVRKQLAENQAQLAKFRADNGVLAYHEQVPLLLQEHENFDRAKRQAEADLVDTEQRIKELELRRATLPAQVLDFSDTQTASHYAGTTRWSRNTALKEVEIELQRNQASAAGLRGRIAELTIQIAGLASDLSKAGEREAYRVFLENEIEAQKDSLRSLTARREEARMRSDLDRREAQNLAFVQAPTLPDPQYPVRPAPVTYMLLSIVCGLGGAVTVAVVSAMCSRQFHIALPARAVAVSASDVPVLGHRPSTFAAESRPAAESKSGLLHD